MITAEKARRWASGLLNSYEKNKKQRAKQSAFLNCYDRVVRAIDYDIQVSAKRQNFSTAVTARPDFYTLSWLGEKPNLEFCSKMERVEIFQDVVYKIKRDLVKKGYEVEIMGERNDENPLFSDELVRIKYVFYISWEDK